MSGNISRKFRRDQVILSALDALLSSSSDNDEAPSYPESLHSLGIDSNCYVYTGYDGVPMSVTDLLVHHSVTAIPFLVFSDRSNLKKVVLCKGVQTIGGTSFRDCISLESIKIPSTVTKIDYWAFAGCTVLKEMVLCEGLQTIGSFAFNSCKSLPRIEIASTVIKIGDHAFGYSRGLK